MSIRLHCEKLGVVREGRPLLDRISLELAPGQITGLIGPNGSGKSSLMRVLAGVMPANTGQARIDGEAYSDDNRSKRARRIAYIPQETAIHWPIKAIELVRLGLLHHLDSDPHTDASRDKDLEDILRDTDARHLRNRTVDTLSGGELARVVLARALATNPDLLLADELTAALDPAHQLSLLSLLSRHRDQGRTICISLHDLSLAASFCDRIILLHQGRLIAHAPPHEVLSAENLNRIYGIRPATLPSRDSSFPKYPWEPIPETN